MITREEMESSFDSESVDIMPPDVAECYFNHPGERRILAEVGLPHGLMGLVIFGYIGTELPRTVAQVLDIGEPDAIPLDIREDIVIANGMGGLACLSRTEGHVYWYAPKGDELNYALINSSLELFVETVCHVWMHLKEVILGHSADEEGSEAEIGEELRRLVAEVRTIDPPSFESPAMYWQHVMLFALRSLAED
ncbi:SUKH-4 family immunity protein [Streptomyces hydrogenans]|uniref:SUKH-4 family immunity protein n=1 Tax=Streptomyces hydrogenans TaxID=1873719 RepID=UPI00382E3612